MNSDKASKVFSNTLGGRTHSLGFAHQFNTLNIKTLPSCN